MKVLEKHGSAYVHLDSASEVEVEQDFRKDETVRLFQNVVQEKDEDVAVPQKIIAVVKKKDSVSLGGIGRGIKRVSIKIWKTLFSKKNALLEGFTVDQYVFILDALLDKILSGDRPLWKSQGFFRVSGVESKKQEMKRIIEAEVRSGERPSFEGVDADSDEYSNMLKFYFSELYEKLARDEKIILANPSIDNLYGIHIALSIAIWERIKRSSESTYQKMIRIFLAVSGEEGRKITLLDPAALALAFPRAAVLIARIFPEDADNIYRETSCGGRGAMEEKFPELRIPLFPQEEAILDQENGSSASFGVTNRSSGVLSLSEISNN